MSHEFDSGFFYNQHGNKEWHRLGKVVTTAPKTFVEAMQLGGMDWNVVEMPLEIDRNRLPEENKENLSNWIDEKFKSEEGVYHTGIPGWKALYRSDNGSLLNVCKSTWKVVQNVDAFAWFEPYLDTGDMEMSAGVSLMGGKRIAITCRMNTPMEVVDNDEVYPYFLLANSHDGTLSVTMRLTSIRTVCNNTLEMNLTGLRGNFAGNMQIRQNSVRIKHSKQVEVNMENVRNFFDVQKQRFEMNVENWQRMANTHITAEEFKKYATKVFARSLKSSTSDLSSDEIELRDIADTNRWEKIKNNFEGGKGADLAPGTVWTALNAITEFTSHVESDDLDTVRSRLNSLYLGDFQRVNSDANKFALELIKS